MKIFKKIDVQYVNKASTFYGDAGAAGGGGGGGGPAPGAGKGKDGCRMINGPKKG